MTRLARVTGLDVLGWPVWHAIRPGSATVAVHAGKGPGERRAMASALGEACEAHAGEAWAARWAGQGELLAPRPLAGEPAPVTAVLLGVSYLCRPTGSSSGLAAGPTLARATLAALLELVERDALARWFRRPALQQASARLAPPHALRRGVARARGAGLDVSFFALPSRAGVPAVACALADHGPAPATARQALGAAARPTGAGAAIAAWAEACQSRCGWMAGARDDLRSPADDDCARAGTGLLPPTPGLGGRLPPDLPALAPAALARLVAARLHGEDAVPVGVVDLTPHHWRERGPRVARVVAPALLPMPVLG